MIYIVVMNYNTGGISIHHIKKDKSMNDFDDLIYHLGYNLDEVSYMVSNTLDIKLC